MGNFGDLNHLLQAGWPIIIMIIIFYFLLYRPQKKQQNKRKDLLASLKRGQKVITVGGIYGEIQELSDQHVMLEIAEKTVIKISRNSIARVLTKEDRANEK